MSLEESPEDFVLASAAGKDVYQGCERKDWSPYRLPKPHVVCWGVEQTQGNINNGGVQYFFENDWLGKPPYDFFIQCFNRIGALTASTCLQKAVAHFPFPEPHLDFKKRREYLDLCADRDGKWNTPFDLLGKQMMDLSGENYTKLATYIRTNVDAFPTAKALLTQK
jgi:hypothetical protein